MTMSARDQLATHAKLHKVSPSQQVNLLLYYLSLAQMFPEITLPAFLERSLRVAGATKENFGFPKDALDQYCPNKDSVWKPQERIDVMAMFVDVNADLATTGDPPLDFAGYLSTEAAAYKTQPPLPPPRVDTATADAPRTRGKKKSTTAPTKLPQVSGRAICRPLIAGMPGPEYLGVVTNIYQVDGAPVADFTCDSGERMTAVPLPYLQDAPAAAAPLLGSPPAAAEPQPTSMAPVTNYQLMIPTASVQEAANLLAMGTPLANRAIGSPLQEFTYNMGDLGEAVFHIVNANPKPYVDAFFCRPGSDIPVCTVPPREHALLGQYPFDVDSSQFTIELVASA